MGAGPKGLLWQNFYFRLEPSRLAYYTPTPQQLQQKSEKDEQKNGKDAQKEEKEEQLGPHAGQFLLEEVLSVNSRGQLCEIEIRDNHDNTHLLRANSKYVSFFHFVPFLAPACLLEYETLVIGDNNTNNNNIERQTKQAVIYNNERIK